MNKNKLNLIHLAVWGIISILTLLFIFTNSLKDGPKSMEQSSVIVEVVESVIDPGHELGTDFITTLVRKSAHFTEFFVLGFSLRMTFIYASRITLKKFWVSPFFISLLAAVTDEFIQSFTGRTSAVADVLIDFSGSSLAIILIMIGMLIYHITRTEKIEITQEEKDAH